MSKNRRIRKLIPNMVGFFKRNKKKVLIFFTGLILGGILGGLIGWQISDHFHRKSIIEQRSVLINNAIFEIKMNKDTCRYKQYLDTASFRTACGLFPYLQIISINELYKSICLFAIADSTMKENFIQAVMDCKDKIEIFNDRVRLRNNYILINLHNVKIFNPYTFEYYHKYVLPSFRKFNNFMVKNKELLIGL